MLTRWIRAAALAAAAALLALLVACSDDSDPNAGDDPGEPGPDVTQYAPAPYAPWGTPGGTPDGTGLGGQGRGVYLSPGYSGSAPVGPAG